MIDNILGYILVADNYYKLWLASDVISKEDSVRFPDPSGVIARQFHDVRDIPTAIEIMDDHPVLDGEGRFHAGNNSPTARLQQMTMRWGSDSYCRLSGNPCKIILEGLRMWHHKDVLHRKRGSAIILRRATFQWNTRKQQGWYRSGGPFSVTLKDISVEATRVLEGETYHSDIRDISVRSMSCSWSDGSGKRLGEERVKKVITDNQISVNYFLAGNSIFQDEGEEFIFWSEIGGDL